MFNQSPDRIVFATQNFLTHVESLQAPLKENALLAEKCNLCFVIGAPAEHLPPSTNDLTLFIDPLDQRRTLPDNCYQITSPAPMDSQKFLQWSQQTSEMIRDTLICPGLIGIDWRDLLNVLEASQEKRFVSHCLDYGPNNQLPIAALQALRFRNVFGCLYGDSSLDLDAYSALGSTLEELNPDIELLKLAMLLRPYLTTRLLLIGEPA